VKTPIAFVSFSRFSSDFRSSGGGTEGFTSGGAGVSVVTGGTAGGGDAASFAGADGVDAAGLARFPRADPVRAGSATRTTGAEATAPPCAVDDGDGPAAVAAGTARASIDATASAEVDAGAFCGGARSIPAHPANSTTPITRAGWQRRASIMGRAVMESGRERLLEAHLRGYRARRMPTVANGDRRPYRRS